MVAVGFNPRNRFDSHTSSTLKGSNILHTVPLCSEPSGLKARSVGLDPWLEIHGYSHQSPSGIKSTGKRQLNEFGRRTARTHLRISAYDHPVWPHQ